MQKLSVLSLCTFLILSSCSTDKKTSSADLYNFYIGTYTQKEGHVDGKGEGVYKIVIDMNSDTMKILKTIKDFINPSFIALSPSEKSLYVANEIGENKDNFNARLSYISIDSLGQHRKAQEAGSYGNAACHVTVNHSGTMYAVSNYMKGELMYGALLPDGKMNPEIKHVIVSGKSVNAARQEAPHLHMAIFTNDDNKLLTCDLGTDSIRVYSVDKTASSLKSIDGIAMKAGDGPRHMVLSKDEKYLYVINELSNSITALSFDNATGKLAIINTASTLPSDYKDANSTAEIQLSNDENFLFASNRGKNSIATFSLDGKGGMKLLGDISVDGKTPRHFMITKDGKYLLVANQDSDNIVVFNVGADGKLNKKASYPMKTPVCIVQSNK